MKKLTPADIDNGDTIENLSKKPTPEEKKALASSFEKAIEFIIEHKLKYTFSAE